MKKITVPVNLEAMKRLNYDSCLPDDLIEYSLSNEEYYKLSETHVFSNLNNKLDIIIDDYEDEIIPTHQLCLANNIVSHKIHQFPECEPLKTIKIYIELAIKHKTAVFLYF